MTTVELVGGVEKRRLVLSEYDPSWPGRYADHEARIRAALGTHVAAVEHVGSTSVPGLAAKPIIDVHVHVHVHVHEHGGAEAQDKVRFRDRLRSSDEDRLLYERAKRHLVAQDWPDMNAYADAKGDVVAQVMARSARRSAR